MFLLIRNGEVYSPQFCGKKDILICNDKIIRLADNIEFDYKYPDFKVIDAGGYKVVPGFIDQHVHLTGGGGEGGPVTRTPEIMLSELTTSGITTAIGLLGTDGITRSVDSLLAKARSLEEEGITTYIYTGCYTLPFSTITGKLNSDIVFIDKIIGAGEIALSDHRSSQLSVEELKKIASEARVAGILAKKCGIVHLHMGDGINGIKPLIEVVRTSDIPIKQFVPTHINRIDHLAHQSIEYIKMGGYVDMTSDIYKTDKTPKSMSISDTLKLYKDNGVPMDRVCASSDSNGSLPNFDENGELISIGVGSTKTLFKDIRDAIIGNIVSFEEGISLITQNPAKILKLYPHKGTIKENSDADILFIDGNLNIDTVIAKGKIMVEKGTALVKGYFEK